MNAWIVLVALAMSPQESSVPPEAAPSPGAVVEDAPAAPELAPAAQVEAPAAAAPVAAQPTGEMGVTGLPGRTEGAITLSAGLVLGVTAMTAFSLGFEIERQLRGREVRGVEVDQALTQRTVAAFVAWPAAVLSLAGVGGGAYLLATSEGEDGATAAAAPASAIGSGR